MNRRTFINTVFRTGILSGIAVLVGVFAYKDKIAPAGECFNDFVCKNCGKLKNCSLPESEKFRRNG